MDDSHSRSGVREHATFTYDPEENCVMVTFGAQHLGEDPWANLDSALDSQVDSGSLDSRVGFSFDEGHARNILGYIIDCSRVHLGRIKVSGYEELKFRKY
ncbi:hypothetical protein JW898_04950 [Candidatus Woesearchaeota archaeon]|nr:hypothetical protein [Candidatus Woesearchaeota archaeon]